MRLVFAGTPEAALPSLEAILQSRHEVAAVVTRPDAPAGRGRRLEPSPVALRARDAGIEVLTPLKARDPAFLDRLREIGPDCCAVTAYGALLPQAALDIPPRLGQPALLRAAGWRGAAPVQHAIWHGDDITGATTFRLVREMDAGPVYGVVTEPVRSRDTAGDLMARLAASGATLLADTLDGIESGEIRAEPQPSEGISFAPKITPDDARVDWGQPATAIDRQIRAFTPEPGAWTEHDGVRLKLGPVEPPARRRGGRPGGWVAGRRARAGRASHHPQRRLRRYRDRTGPARGRPAAGQALHAGRRLGPRPARARRRRPPEARLRCPVPRPAAPRPVSGQGAPARPALDPVRRVAYDVLSAVDQRDAYANLLLPTLLRERGIEGRDAALATELTYGTLRGRQTYDAILGVCSDRPPDQMDPPVREVLRLGAHQLLATRVPSHAAVATSVDLAKDVAGMRPAGFVNAVLRRVSTREDGGVADDHRARPLGQPRRKPGSNATQL